MKWSWLSLSLLTVPGTALADWDYSHWGNTPSEIIAASAGKASITKGHRRRHQGDKSALVTASTQLAGQDFLAEYWFDHAKRLAWISYWPQALIGCDQERDLITEKWGKPSTRVKLGRTNILSGIVQYRSAVDEWVLDNRNVMMFQILHFSHVGNDDVDARELCALVVAPPGTLPFKEMP